MTETQAKEIQKELENRQKLVNRLSEAKNINSVKKLIKLLFNVYILNNDIIRNSGRNHFGWEDIEVIFRWSSRLDFEPDDSSNTEIDDDLNFYYSIVGKKVKMSHDWTTASRILCTGHIFRQHNCCGMGVITDLTKDYIPRNKGFGTFNLLVAQTIAYLSEYAVVMGTGQVNYSDDMLRWLEKRGFTIDRTWRNYRTMTELYSVSKELTLKKLTNEWCKLLKIKD